jgi:hypothetical protein
MEEESTTTGLSTCGLQGRLRSSETQFSYTEIRKINILFQSGGQGGVIIISLIRELSIAFSYDRPNRYQ